MTTPGQRPNENPTLNSDKKADSLISVTCFTERREKIYMKTNKFDRKPAHLCPEYNSPPRLIYQ